jgi:tRNA nucleotidyltransferase (CCA-adding enzyme)
VTLEEDLARRDLTINAIAKDSNGHYIDPYHGLADIQSKTLRHVSLAFTEDPVRILRAARFAARLTEFSVATETMTLMQQMTAAGEVDALVAERVWQELAKGLMEAQPSRMFAVLRDCGALQKIMPELDCLWGAPMSAQFDAKVDAGVHVMRVIDDAASHHFSLAVRFAALLHDLGKGLTFIDGLPQPIGHEDQGVILVKEVCRRLKVPNDCRELAHIVVKFQGKLHQTSQLSADSLLDFLIEIDAIRQPARFRQFLDVCASVATDMTDLKKTVASDLLLKGLAAAQSVNAGEVASAYTEAQKIKRAIYTARVEAIKQNLANTI